MDKGKIRLLLSGGYVPSFHSHSDIVIEDGVISSIVPQGQIDPVGFSSSGRVIDCKGLTVVSGFVDVHVHFREPGFGYKETIRTGSMAAAHGGYTTVCPMPNLNPCPDCPENLKVETDIIDRDAVIKVIPYGTITKGQKGSGELIDFKPLVGKVAGFSDDGRGVQASSLMEAAMREVAAVDGIIAAHCEVNDLLSGGYIHDGKYAAAHGHKGICSESEWGEVKRDILLSEKTGCRYHVCHISTKESVQLIREAQGRGADVTCETGPHYLVLCEDDLQEDGRFKMNPPLRSAEDRAALIEGLKDGTITMIATDHAPHSAEEKSRGLQGSAMGIVGLETAFPVLYTELVLKGVITFDRLMELMSEAPRRRFRLGGGLQPGQPADITLLDLEKTYTIDPDKFLSKGHATPFAGRKVTGEVAMTLVDGRIAYERNNA